MMSYGILGQAGYQYHNLRFVDISHATCALDADNAGTPIDLIVQITLEPQVYLGNLTMIIVEKRL